MLDFRLRQTLTRTIVRATQPAEKINCNSAGVEEFSNTACTRCYSMFAFRIREESPYGCSLRTTATTA